MPEILAKPHPAVVAALERYADVADVHFNLPDIALISAAVLTKVWAPASSVQSPHYDQHGLLFSGSSPQVLRIIIACRQVAEPVERCHCRHDPENQVAILTRGVDPLAQGSQPDLASV